MPAAIVIFALQLLVAVHAIRTGRPTFWVWLIIAVPVLGSVIYLVVEVLPELSRRRAAGRAARGVGDTVDPTRQLRASEEALARSDTLANRVALADAHMALAQYEAARAVYARCLQSPDEQDPDILLKLARADFEAGDPGATRATLERLIESNPDFRSSDGHLLYARALEALGETKMAADEYAALVPSYPGEEAGVRYARVLMALERTTEARELLSEALRRARRAPAFYQNRERPWLREAEALLDEMVAEDGA